VTVIALVGMPGAGKTLVAEHLSKLSFPVVRFGQIIINELVSRGLPVNPEHEQKIRLELRQLNGMDACAKKALPLIKSALKERGVVVVDGLYSFSEYKRLHEEFGNDLVVIAIAAPRSVRYRRLANRPDRPFSEEQARQRDYHEIENIEKGGPIAIADYTIVNGDGVDELRNQVDTLLKQVLPNDSFRKS
jgi:dephospho-CoA kinase